jgi:hypothetical protein
LDELSAQPILLQAMISTQSGLSYDEAKQTLVIDAWQDEALYAVNSLLSSLCLKLKKLI